VSVLPIDDADAALYTIGQVAEMIHVRIAFLRRLDERGVVAPARSAGGQRRYSRREISQVTEAMKLIDEGLTLVGVRRVLALQERICGLEAELAARDAAGERGNRAADGSALAETRERAGGR
jgi:MerR family transcriptional regulator/heat shock protein HspR